MSVFRQRVCDGGERGSPDPLGFASLQEHDRVQAIAAPGAVQRRASAHLTRRLDPAHRCERADDGVMVKRVTRVLASLHDVREAVLGDGEHDVDAFLGGIRGEVRDGRVRDERVAVATGAQAALMAPTELLAEQHFRSLAGLFETAGPRVAILTSSVTGAARAQTLKALADGGIDVLVGTHALVEEGVSFKRLALAIVDEQHRFGVRQRASFRDKGIDPHLLLTTATPIPQTLNQTLYRDLDISVLPELPSGQQQIRTEVRTADALPKVWPWIRERVAQGEQAFVVTPRIDEDPEDELPSAEAVFRDLSKRELAGLRVALLHGRMPPKDRDKVMGRFAEREIDVLVATTVVEVGIDIPGATVMVILGAERFGLAQLHQLRGRVGRRGQKAFAILVSEKAEESERLAAMTEVSARTGKPLNGFELADRDLKIRGAGQFLGKEQSGENELRIVDLADADPELIDETRVEADALLAADPLLERPEHALLNAAVDQLYRRFAQA